jgi:Septum formation
MSSPTADSTAEDAQPPAPPALAEKPRFSAIAVAALPAGVLPLVPLGLGLGIAGLVITRHGRRRGRGLAVAALLTATGWLAVGAALGTVAYLTHGFHKPTKIEYNDQLGTVFSLRAGDCIINSPNQTSPSRTSCSTPHDAEVFATIALPKGPWPGTATVQQEAADECSTRLAGYLNPQLAISLAQDYVYPGQLAWQTGTRTVVCEVRAQSGQLDQSVRGAA